MPMNQSKLDLISLPNKFTTGCCFCFGSSCSFFLKLFLHWSRVAYWAPPDLGSSSFQCPIFLPFHTVHGVLKAILKGLPFPSPVDHIFSELSTMTRLSWVALHGMAHSFIELDKAVVHVIRLVSYLPLKCETEFCSQNRKWIPQIQKHSDGQSLF